MVCGLDQACHMISPGPSVEMERVGEGGNGLSWTLGWVISAWQGWMEGVGEILTSSCQPVLLEMAVEWPGDRQDDQCVLASGGHCESMDAT